MDCCDGEFGNTVTPLDRFGQKYGVVSEKDARDYIAQAIFALKSLHARGIWHGDIKPANFGVMENKKLNKHDWSPKYYLQLLDFGCSAYVKNQEAIKYRKSELVGTRNQGTPGFLAPHVVKALDGRYSYVSTQTSADDWFALGCMAMYLTCGYCFDYKNNTDVDGKRDIDYYRKVMSGDNDAKAIMSQAFQEFVCKLLNYDLDTDN